MSDLTDLKDLTEGTEVVVETPAQPAAPLRQQELDQYGRVIIRKTPEEDSGFPPAPPEHLIVKAQRLLVRYERTGPAVFLSQLESQHIFDRALRRARLPLAFSQGFHPLPLLSFGRALPVGVAGEAEWFTIVLRERVDLPAALAGLNQGLPGGLRVTGLEDIPLNAKITDQTHEVYEVRCVGTKDGRAAFLPAWEAVRAAAVLPFVRETKKGVRSMDLRPFIAGIEALDEAGVRLELDWSTGYLSPPILCRAALAQAGLELAPQHFVLTKKALTPA